MDFASRLNSKELHPNKQWVGRLKARTEISPGLFEIVIEITEIGFKFTAGQYVWIQIPGLKTKDRRAFSLVNADGQVKIISIIVRESKSEYKQKLLNKELGSSLIVLGPHGSSFTLQKQDKHIILIAGGTGIAPFISLARSHQTTADHRKLDFIYISSDDEITYEHELQQISKASNNITITISKSKREWEKQKSRLTNVANARYFISGTQPFVDDTSDLLNSLGVSYDRQVYEQNHPTKSTNMALTPVIESISSHSTSNALGQYSESFETSRQKILSKYMKVFFFLYAGVVSSSVLAYLVTAVSSEVNNKVALPAYGTAFFLLLIAITYWKVKKNDSTTGKLLSLFATIVVSLAVIAEIDFVTSYTWISLPPLFYFMFFSSKKAIRTSLIYLAFVYAVHAIALFQTNPETGLTVGFILQSVAKTTVSIILLYYISLIISASDKSLVVEKQSLDLVFGSFINSPTSLVITDNNGKIVYANQSAIQMTGFSFSEMKGNTPRLWGGLMEPDFYELMWDTLSTKKSFNHEVTNRNKDGELYSAIAIITPILDISSDIVGYFATEEDVTKLRIEEVILNKNLRDQKMISTAAQLTNTVESLNVSMPEVLSLVGAQLEVTNICIVSIGKASIEVKHRWSKNQEDTTKRFCSDFPLMNQLINKKEFLTINQTGNLSGETQKKLDEYNIKDISTVYLNTEGTKDYFMVISSTDDNHNWLSTELDTLEILTNLISSALEKFEAKTKLEQNEKLLNYALEGSNEGVWDWDIAEDKYSNSDKWRNILGYRSKAVEPKTAAQWNETIHPNDRKYLLQKLNEHLTGKSPAFENEMRVKCANGKYRWILSRGMVVNRTPDGKPIRMVGTISDIEKFKRATEQADTFFDLSLDLLCIINSLGNFLRVSPAFSEILGYKEDEILKINVIDLVHKDDKKIFEKDFLKALPGTKISGIKIRYKHKNGNFHWINWTGNVTYDNLIYAVARDISKEEEISQAKTEFVSLASHQLRTPLTSIKWYSEMLLDNEGGGLTKFQTEYTNEIHDGNERMINLVNSLLNISRLELGTFNIDPRELDLQKECDLALKSLKVQIQSRKIDVNKELSKLPKTYQGDPVIISIVMENLISNAVKYTKIGGKVKISTSVASKADLQKDRKISEGDYIIAVADNGIGIPAGDQATIFSKLYRASNAQKHDANGNGLGLYIVKSAINAAGGDMWFDSKESEGSTFYVSLPKQGFTRRRGAKPLEIVV